MIPPSTRLEKGYSERSIMRGDAGNVYGSAGTIHDIKRPPEHIWTYLVNVEDYGFQPPTLVMVTNLLSYPDQDQSMAVFTGLYGQELLRMRYAHMVWCLWHGQHASI